MRISELAAETGLSIDTIRYYEKRGLLNERHMTRGSNRYRTYNEAAIERLAHIKQGQMLGMTLNEMCEVLQDWENDAFSPDEVRAFFVEKIDQVDARIAELKQMRAYLCDKLKNIG